MENKTIEEAIKENQHRTNMIAIQKERLEKTLAEFKVKIDRLKERKNELKEGADSGRPKDVQKYNDFIKQYVIFAESVDKERKKIETTVRSLCEQNFIKSSTLQMIMQSLSLNGQQGSPERGGAAQQRSGHGKFSATRL